jgi:glycosyltransferase involved in cell wall biosynthesis
VRLKLSVVVPAFNEEKVLPRSLAAIRAAMAGFDDSELIVCDNNSSDRTAAIAREAGAKVVFERINQISRARNAGASAASGDWLVFVDADSYPSRELFLELGRVIGEGRCLAGGATVTFGDTTPAAKLVVGLWNGISRSTRWAAGSFMFCEARAFREEGGFSEALYAAEEIELFVRLKRRARRDGRSIVILDRHPLLSSDRRVRLTGWWSFLRHAGRAAVTGGRSLRTRDGCAIWYDGRR